MIRRRSIPGFRGFFYVKGDRDLASPLFDGSSISEILQGLVDRRLALAIPAVQFNQGHLEVHWAFLVRSGPPEIIEYMYADAIKNSTGAILCWFDTIKDLPQRLAEELQHTSAIVHSENVAFFRPMRMLQSAQTTVQVRPTIIAEFCSDLIKELLKADRVLRVGEDTYFPLIENQILPCYEFAGKCLDAELRLAVKKRPGLGARLKRLSAAEVRYNSDPKNNPSGRYLKRRAAIIRRVVESNEISRTLSRVTAFIGALAVRAEQAYRRAAEAQDRATVEQFESELLNHGGDWRKMVHRVKTAERKQIRSTVWATLLSHRNLFWIRYERPGETYFLFMARDRQSLPGLMQGMLTLKSADYWLITALKELIESNEEFWSPVLQDPAVSAVYGQLLRRAYKDFIPWYGRLLLLLNIESIAAPLFAKAKQKLLAEQKKLARSNAHVGPQKPNRRTRRPVSLSVAAINFALERAYFDLHTVPSLLEIANFVSAPDFEVFRQTVESENYRILRTGEYQNSVLFFRDEVRYADQIKKLRANLPRRIIELENAAGVDSPRVIRAKRLQVFLGRPKTKPTEGDQSVHKSALIQ